MNLLIFWQKCRHDFLNCVSYFSKSNFPTADTPFLLLRFLTFGHLLYTTARQAAEALAKHACDTSWTNTPQKLMSFFIRSQNQWLPATKDKPGELANAEVTSITDAEGTVFRFELDRVKLHIKEWNSRAPY